MSPFVAVALALGLAGAGAVGAVAAAAGVSCTSSTAAKINDDLTNCQVLSQYHSLRWSITPDNSTITFGVDVANLPISDDIKNYWFAIGLSDEGGMRTADEWILRQYANGTFYIQDSYTDDYAQPSPDASQDVSLIGSPVVSSTDASIAFRITRPLLTCDSKDLSVGFDTLHGVIWAYGTQSNGAISQHCPTCRGNTYITLWKDPTVVPIPDPADKRLLSATMPNITIPSKSTTYYCINFQTPNDAKYHIIEYEGVVTTQYIHHMVVFACPKAPSEPFGQSYECTMQTACAVVLVWVPGSLTQKYPPEAGTAIGVGGNAYQYMILQVHYNNPTLDAGKVDSSGMNMYYTPTLRKYDVGVLVLGDVYFKIPGNSPDYTVLSPNICQSSCTSQFPGNLTLFSSMTHMHLLGHNQTVKQIRNGVELEPLLIRKNYDFGFQNYQALKGRTLVPGDELITTCGFIPTQGVRNGTTTYGEGTNNEMCFNFLEYYPKVPDIDYCVTLDPLNSSFCGNLNFKNNLLNTQTLADPRALRIQADKLIRDNRASNFLTDANSITPTIVNQYTPYVPPVCVPSAKSGQANSSSSTVPVSTTGSRPSSAFNLAPVSWYFLSLFVIALFSVLF